MRMTTIPVRSSAAGRWPCRTFSRPSGVTGLCRPSSILSASSRAVISSTPEPLTIRRSQPTRVCAASLKRGRRASVPSMTLVQVALVGGARDRGQRQQRRDVADGVAPARVGERRRDGEIGARLGVRVGRDQDRARVGGPASRPASPRCPPRARRRSARRRPAGRARPRRRRGRARRAARRRPSRRARSCRSRSRRRSRSRGSTRPPPAPPSEARIGATSPGSARIISSMAHGGPARSSGMSLMAEHGTV